MLNEITVKFTREQITDLMYACSYIHMRSSYYNEERIKWRKLHDVLKTIRDDFDRNMGFGDVYTDTDSIKDDNE